ncbi:MAG: SPFH domain-containing protein [Chloroflexota bacterium]|nr:SPFH domain-containing protein [Chloroflexota bacterium]
MLRIVLLGLVILIITLLGTLGEVGARGTTTPDIAADFLNNGDWWRPVLFSLVIVRNTFLAVLVLILVPLLASRFIHALYATHSLREAHTFLHRCVFGLTRPRPYLLVKEGHIDKGKDSLLDRLGGPGNVAIFGDSAAVLERGGHLTRVLGPGFHSLERFEKIWETIDLRPQRWVHKVEAMTKEGIRVACDADITFKINSGGQPPTEKKPYPFTKEAVFRAATSTWVHEPDQEAWKMKWPALIVVGEATGILRSIISRYRLDWLIAPSRPGNTPPRQAIREELENKLHSSAGSLGAEIIKVELGEIEVSEKVSQQWIKAWQSDWQREAVLQQAEGEAELARLEAAEVQAQAEMILMITQALQPLISAEEQVSPYRVAVRFIETLRWMLYDPRSRGFLPPETMNTLTLLQNKVTEKQEET